VSSFFYSPKKITQQDSQQKDLESIFSLYPSNFRWIFSQASEGEFTDGALIGRWDGVVRWAGVTAKLSPDAPVFLAGHPLWAMSLIGNVQGSGERVGLSWGWF
jgi:hypothetical protein